MSNNEEAEATYPPMWETTEKPKASDRFLLAVDPGKSGGLAWFAPGIGVQSCKMPETDEALLEQLQVVALGRGCPVHAYIELVGGYVRKRDEDDEDGGGQPGSAMFRFGENAGLVRGILMGLGATVHLVPPRNWQKPLFMKKGQSSKQEWKNKLKNAAQRRFPGIKVTLQTADALLILSFAAALNNVDAHVIQKGNSKPEPRRGGKVTPAPEKRATRSVCEQQRGNGDPWKGARVAFPPPVTGRLVLADWKGTPFVFREHEGGMMLIRKATQDDQRNLPSAVS